MAELRALVEDLRFAGARTLIAGGNAVFRTYVPTGRELESLLEDAIAERIGPRLDVMVRDRETWAEIVAAHPFPEDAATRPSKAARRPGKLLAACSRRPRTRKPPALRGDSRAARKAKVLGDVAWLVFIDGESLGKLLAPSLLKRTPGFSATARNWNTVGRLKSLADEAAAN
jgi:uncharacterized protein (DUF1697 family)